MLFLDIETQNTFADVGMNNLAGLKISYVGAIDGEGKEYDFWESDMEKLGECMKELGPVIHYNGYYFDMPVIANYLGEDVMDIPQIDLMVAAQKALGFRPKLDMIANATLGYGKTGDGLDAIKYWVQGQLDALKSYCLQDVKVTKELFEYGVEEEHIKFFNKDGFLVKADIDWRWGKREEKVEEPETMSMF